MLIKITCILFTALLAATSQAVLDDLFYHPDGKEYATPKEDGYAYEEIQFLSKDGTKLSGWFIPAKGKALGTIIHFHGNAQNMSAHYAFVSWLPANGFNLFVFDYRGYGRSEGKLSRKGVYEDSVAAVEYIKTRTDIDQNKLILFGQSLGGANAIAVAGSTTFDGIVGVVSDSAFSSYKGVATDHAGILKPFAYLLIGNKYSPKKVVKNISPTPLVIIHGTDDPVVPYKHAEILFKKACEPKNLWTIEGGQHTEALGRFGQEVAPRLHQLFKSWVEQETISDQKLEPTAEPPLSSI
jgi:fermentation-respiration switch protein FrsA (DUF1100 family)